VRQCVVVKCSLALLFTTLAHNGVEDAAGETRRKAGKHPLVLPVFLSLAFFGKSSEAKSARTVRDLFKYLRKPSGKCNDVCSATSMKACKGIDVFNYLPFFVTDKCKAVLTRSKGCRLSSSYVSLVSLADLNLDLFCLCLSHLFNSTCLQRKKRQSCQV